MKYVLFSLFLCSFTYALTESTIGSEFSVFHQPGVRFSNQGYATVAKAEQTLSSGLILTEKAGYERFLGDTGSHSGLRASVLSHYVIDNHKEVKSGAGYRTLGRNWGDFELETLFLSRDEAREWEVGFSRTFIMDSYLSYVGTTLEDGQTLGEARLHQFHASSTWNDGILRYRLNPRAGWIGVGSSPSNFKGGLLGSVELLMIEEDILDLDLVYTASVDHYQFDQSGFALTNFEPYGGGYFSPRLFIEQVPHIAVRYRPVSDMQLSLSVGPSIQITREFQKGSRTGLGAVTDFGFDYRMNKHASLKASVAYHSLEDQFGRFQSSFALAYGI